MWEHYRDSPVVLLIEYFYSKGFEKNIYSVLGTCQAFYLIRLYYSLEVYHYYLHFTDEETEEWKSHLPEPYNLSPWLFFLRGFIFLKSSLRPVWGSKSRPQDEESHTLYWPSTAPQNTLFLRKSCYENVSWTKQKACADFLISLSGPKLLLSQKGHRHKRGALNGTKSALWTLEFLIETYRKGLVNQCPSPQLTNSKDHPQTNKLIGIHWFSPQSTTELTWQDGEESTWQVRLKALYRNYFTL